MARSLMDGAVSKELKDQVIRMAWEDRTTFDDILKKTGFRESEVIKLMRKSLKPGSFRRWRARVTGRITKHRKPFQKLQKDLRRPKVICEDWEE